MSGAPWADEYPDDDDEWDGYLPEHPLERLEYEQDAQHDAEHGPGECDF